MFSIKYHPQINFLHFEQNGFLAIVMLKEQYLAGKSSLRLSFNIFARDAARVQGPVVQS